jgi:hypothetical protein
MVPNGGRISKEVAKLTIEMLHGGVAYATHLRSCASIEVPAAAGAAGP